MILFIGNISFGFQLVKSAKNLGENINIKKMTFSSIRPGGASNKTAKSADGNKPAKSVSFADKKQVKEFDDAEPVNQPSGREWEEGVGEEEEEEEKSSSDDALSQGELLAVTDSDPDSDQDDNGILLTALTGTC